MERVSVVRAWELVQMGEALIVDLREPSEFARGHPKGALSLPYSEKGLEDRLGVLLQPGSPVVLLAEAPGQAQSAVLQLQESAFPVVGVVGGSMMAWSDSDLPLEILAEVSRDKGVRACILTGNGRAFQVRPRSRERWMAPLLPKAPSPLPLRPHQAMTVPSTQSLVIRSVRKSATYTVSPMTATATSRLKSGQRATRELSSANFLISPF